MLISWKLTIPGISKDDSDIRNTEALRIPKRYRHPITFEGTADGLFLDSAS
jgi:hypothetical protein